MLRFSVNQFLSLRAIILCETIETQHQFAVSLKTYTVGAAYFSQARMRMRMRIAYGVCRMRMHIAYVNSI